MVSDVLKDLQGSLDKGIEAFKRDLAKVRTGRANLAILDGIKVDYYGTPTPLNQVASLNVPDARLITIKPWEKTLIPEIEKAIRAAQLGLNPSSDGEIVRVPMPALTEERRKELVKVVKKMAEEAKVALRAPRRDANEMLKDFLKDKQITEDEEKAGLKKVQDATDASVDQGRRDPGQERSRDPRGLSRDPAQVLPGLLFASGCRVLGRLFRRATPLALSLSNVTLATSTWLRTKRTMVPLPLSSTSRCISG